MIRLNFLYAYDDDSYMMLLTRSAFFKEHVMCLPRFLNLPLKFRNVKLVASRHDGTLPAGTLNFGSRKEYSRRQRYCSEVQMGQDQGRGGRPRLTFGAPKTRLRSDPSLLEQPRPNSTRARVCSREELVMDHIKRLDGVAPIDHARDAGGTVSGRKESE